MLQLIFTQEEKETHPVLHLGTKGTTTNNIVVWNIPKLQDPKYYTLSAGVF